MPNVKGFSGIKGDSSRPTPPEKRERPGEGWMAPFSTPATSLFLLVNDGRT